ncbi:MAG: ATP-binding cassette domain-containing protein [Actinomycetota bacterium]|nr:ATP-binding cassette domain-containing protein [Actinomycetota bacterium]
MGSIEVVDVEHSFPGRTLFSGVSFRVPSGSHVALVGANGAGKTTLLRMVAAEEVPGSGSVRIDGRLGYMRQFVASHDPEATVRDFLAGLAPKAVHLAHDELRHMEFIVAGPHGGSARDRYAHALAAWGDAGGYAYEVLWDTCAQSALGAGFDRVGFRPITTLSGGEQKRLALEAFLRSEDDVLLLDEPDNFLDIPGKRWLENRLNASRKTILFVSHDRALLAETAHAIVTIEGGTVWTHHGGFDTYATARADRLERIDDERRRYDEEHERIVAQIREFKRRAALNEKFAKRARATEKKLERFERDRAPRTAVREQDVRMDLSGGRSGKVVVRARGLAIPGLVQSFDTEIHFGERVGVVGSNGTGKTHFMKLLAGEDIRHEGEWMLGARVNAALFSQLHERPELAELTPVEALQKEALDFGQAMRVLNRYGLAEVARLPFRMLSGGQQARFQILLIEVQGSTLLLLDEPTDNLDIDSAEALEEAILDYEGTVLVVTHDRWLMRLLERFLVFGDDGSVTEALERPYV